MAIEQGVAVVVTGVTGSGKTEVALELANSCDWTVVSLDSVMVYRGADIGSAKPLPAVLTSIPHQLVDICTPEQRYSVGQFFDDVSQIIDSTSTNLLFVGGTMLYLNALLYGLADLPAASAEIRQDFEEQVAKRGLVAVHAELSDDDYVRSKVAANDFKRIERAYEIRELTGMNISAAHVEYHRASPLLRHRTSLFELTPNVDSSEAYEQALELRINTMLADGWFEEVEQLMLACGSQNYGGWATAVGYNQIVNALQNGQHIDGCEQQQLVDQIVIATRQLAKRQRTWMRKLKRESVIQSLRAGPVATDIISRHLEYTVK